MIMLMMESLESKISNQLNNKKMNRITYEAEFFDKSQHPKMELGAHYSVDVITCDSDGLLNIAFYDYDTDEWIFHADTMHDHKTIDFIWMYAPEEFILKVKQKLSEYKEGDIVPYKNSRGNIKLAKITSFETVDNGKIWFRGIDTVTSAKVYYPVHLSKKLKANKI